MTTFETFGRDIRLASDGFSQEAMSRELAKFAKSEIKRVVATGQGSANYQTFVNGREGSPEDSVQAPGPIVYVFMNWRLIVEHAIDALIRNSPRKSGAFQRSFLVIANGRTVADYGAIDGDAEVIITNSRPYVRKVQVGAMKMSVPPKVFDKARRAVFSRFGQQLVAGEVTFLRLPGGLHPDIPYVLKGSRGRQSRRKDRAPGQQLTYPALVLNMVR